MPRPQPGQHNDKAELSSESGLPKAESLGSAPAIPTWSGSGDEVIDCFVQYDPEQRIRYMNDNLCQLMGIGDVSSVLGQTPSELWPDGRWSDIETACKTAVVSGKAAFVDAFEDEARRVVHQVSVVPFRDGQGVIAGAIAVGRDVSSPRYLMQQLQEQLTFQEALLTALGEAGVELTIIDNERVVQAHGKNTEWRRRVAAFTAGGISADAIQLDECEWGMDHFKAHLAGDSSVPAQFECGLLTPEGELRIYEVAVVVVPDSSVRRMVSIAKDVTERRASARQMKILQHVIHQSTDAMFINDTEFRFVDVNDVACVRYGYSRDELLGMTISDIDPEFVPRDFSLIFGEVSRLAERRHRNKDGRCFPVEILLSAQRVGNEQYGVSMARDISERKEFEALLVQREEQYRSLAENSPDIIVRYDLEGRRIYVNPAYEKLTSHSIAVVRGTRPDASWPGSIPVEEYRDLIQQVRASGLPIRAYMSWKQAEMEEPRYFKLQLLPEFGQSNAVKSVLAIGHDVTELEASREKMRQMAFFDSLTGLPNRDLLGDRLRQAIVDADYHGRKIGLMLIDLDRFKIINDTQGHDAGDELLCEMADRLKESIRSYDTVARLGGDEFVVLLPEVRDGADLGRIAEKILRMLSLPYRIRGKEFFLGASIGVVLYPEDRYDGADVEKTASDLMMHADAAMYHVKRQGRNGFGFYSAQLSELASRNVAIEMGLRYALDRGELHLHFQPKVGLADGRVVGSEALLRWHSAELGTVPPDQFIPIAEDNGLISEIGHWVLREACRAAVEWNECEQEVHKVAINLSGRQFQNPALVRTVRTVLLETGCNPHWIELEITESLLLDQDAPVAGMLSALRAMGITIAIDDFGTGYSSLNYLSNYSIDTLKIDRSFIQSMTQDSRKAELVRAILSIAACLGQEVVAEGVETPEQVRMLQEAGCQLAQGWYYGKAISKAEMDALIATAPLPKLPLS